MFQLEIQLLVNLNQEKTLLWQLRSWLDCYQEHWLSQSPTLPMLSRLDSKHREEKLIQARLDTKEHLIAIERLSLQTESLDFGSVLSQIF